MTCPHCSTVVRFEWNHVELPKEALEDEWYYLFYSNCPSCNDMVIYYSLCNTTFVGNIGRTILSTGDGNYDIISEEMIYPKRARFENTDLVPQKYLEDYEEALTVVGVSPKSSAALSRRLLQLILRDEYSIKKRNLSDEIQAFISLEGIPSHITDAVDAIRNIGNLAAHPTKNSNTGEIVGVEPGEAEWLIEVIEALFDFIFIQPKKLAKRKEELNKKLAELGKPSMKEKPSD